MILLIDNYDSFTFNLYQMAGEVDPDILVIKNDEMQLAEIEALAPSHIILSPGPGKPSDAGITEEVVLKMKDKCPILGICLGHQAIAEAHGAVVSYAKELRHGKKSWVHIANGNPIFKGLPPMIEAARYHSLSVLRETLPDSLLVIAESEDAEVMGIKHKECDLYGLQFHPESILTPGGAGIIRNFLSIGRSEA